MPQALRSLTLNTLLITSLPRLSNTRTFHIGSPSELSIGVEDGMRPFVADDSWCSSVCSCRVWLRFSMRCMEARRSVVVDLKVCSTHRFDDRVESGMLQPCWKSLAVKQQSPYLLYMLCVSLAWVATSCSLSMFEVVNAVRVAKIRQARASAKSSAAQLPSCLLLLTSLTLHDSPT